MSTGQKTSVKTSGRSRYQKKYSRPRSAKSGKSSRSHKSREGNVRGGGNTQEYAKAFHGVGINESFNGSRKRQSSKNNQKKSLNRSKSSRASKLKQFKVERFRRSKSKEFIKQNSADGRLPAQRNNQGKQKRLGNQNNQLNNYDSKHDFREGHKIDIQINEMDETNRRYKIVGFPSTSSNGDNRLLSQMNTKFNEQVKFNNN